MIGFSICVPDVVMVLSGEVGCVEVVDTSAHSQWIIAPKAAKAGASLDSGLWLCRQNAGVLRFAHVTIARAPGLHGLTVKQTKGQLLIIC
jgi:hypothetical protein